MKKIKKHLKLITILVVMIVITIIIATKSMLEKNSKQEIIKEGEIGEIIVDISKKEEENNVDIQTNLEEHKENINFVYVDIKGAVNNPGVYEISSDKKVIDVVELAGGFASNADTSLINLAKQVKDEMVIIIYTVEEIQKSKEENVVVKIVEKECKCPEINNDACINSDNELKEEKTEEINGKININKATLDELQTINGIGKSKAEAIIEYRTTNGNFKSVEEILNVSGIGETLYEQIKEHITI